MRFEADDMNNSMLQQRSQVLTCAVFRCKNYTNQTKRSSNFLPTQKLTESQNYFFKLIIFPLLVLIALSCSVPTVGARTTSSHRSLTTNYTLTTGLHRNSLSPIGKSHGLRASFSPARRFPRLPRKRGRKSAHPNQRRHQRSKSMKKTPRKVHRRKTKGKGRKRKGCKKK